MARFQIFNAAGVGMNIGSTWYVPPEHTANIVSDNGSTAWFTVPPGYGFTRYAIDYATDGMGSLLIKNVGYYYGNTMVQSVEGLNLRTTMGTFFSPTGFTITGLNSGHDTFIGNGFADTIRAGIGNDVVVGYGGNDSLYGEIGNDRLFGGDGNDLLSGGDGLDYLWGGLGRDILSGGSGSDIFDFDTAAESRKGTGRDIITDFEKGIDVIDLRGIDADIDTSDGGKRNEAFIWIGGKKFSGVDGELRVENGILKGDTNGDKKADFEIDIGFNKLRVTSNLETSDIWL